MKKEMGMRGWARWGLVMGFVVAALAGVLTLAPGTAMGSESCWYVAGEWTLLHQETSSACGFSPPYDRWVDTVTQQGCDLTVKNTYFTAAGTIDGAVATWSGQWEVPGWLFKEDWEVTFSGSSISGGFDFSIIMGGSDSGCPARAEVVGTAALIAPTAGVPEAPILSVSADSSEVDISWTPVDGARGYILALAMVDTTGNIIPAAVGAFDWPGTSLSAELPMDFAAYIAVAAYGEAGPGGLSNVMFFKIF